MVVALTCIFVRHSTFRVGLHAPNSADAFVPAFTLINMFFILSQ